MSGKDRAELERLARERGAVDAPPDSVEAERRGIEAKRRDAKQRGDFVTWGAQGRKLRALDGSAETAPESDGEPGDPTDGPARSEPAGGDFGGSGGIPADPADPDPVSGPESDAGGPRRGTGRVESAPERVPESVARGHAPPGKRRRRTRPGKAASDPDSPAPDAEAAAAEGVPDLTPEQFADLWPHCPEDARMEALVNHLDDPRLGALKARLADPRQGAHEMLMALATGQAPAPELLANWREDWPVLAPMVRALAPLASAEVDRRPNAIVPRMLAATAHVEGRERLAPFDSPEGLQGHLPGFEPSPPGLVPSFPLPVEQNPGQGAPIWQRLALELLIAARMEARRGSYEPLPVTLGDLIDFAGWATYKPERHVPALRTALRRLRNWTVAHARREWWPFHPQAMPTRATKRGDVLPIGVAIPDGMAPGPTVERGYVRELGKRTAPGWRAWVRLNLFWDRYSTSGRLLRATVPEVERAGAGQIVDVHGRPLTPRRGKPAHWSDPRAIRTGERVANPNAVRVPVFEPGDLLALGYEPGDLPGPAFRKRRARVRKVLATLERAGRVLIDRSATDRNGRKGWRILPP